VAPPAGIDAPRKEMPRKPAAPVEEERDTPEEVDIPGFTVIKKGIASGQRPDLGGPDWLKKHRYRTVLHVVPPGEDDSAARRMFEGKGLHYVPLEASAATLSQEVLERFEKAINDPLMQPVFAYAEDNALLGALWYLHFRVHDKLSPEKARVRAERLGYKADEPENKTLEIAVQKLLSELLKKGR
jgi:hypothetical protein